ncbi:ribosomal-processing cysteine protease Prp [Leptospira bourretii]|uniref:Ribosomal processing cysteine protease Prp n=1 Tax=Leptospira bourretii TaxID=2484962 RepID=A0A4R9IL78_9LEPT|nr:ribosomal-processing cysteine protease Prp [Leptospira bourretii]TGK79662.1 ribosomal-processing cysteine protease Prp [Leptospira bourretii]TGK89872.1 ribosomal-processing cysteine protease Prp [Leptospira bourretii]TGL19367.1 ribosomal-processing cysteine protease Prp [Leptospira bourretii]TGL35667.1 ribosomal-processing cysteine protease Prp [Leptospira bourretii]
MIYSIIFKDLGGQIAGIQLEGHSPKDLGSKGENLLCAGVSTLVQSAHSYLASQDSLESEEKRDGYLSFLIKKDQRVGYQSLLSMVEFGLKSLERSHSQAISIQDEIIKG